MPLETNQPRVLKNYCKKLKTCSKHVTFCKVGPCKELGLENHVSEQGLTTTTTILAKMVKYFTNQQKLRNNLR
jgi:hypothetical protein